jgi:tartronate-semialdehyde synthase
MEQYRVSVVVGILLERVTKMATGTEIDNVVEFEGPALDGEDAPTAFVLPD